MKSKNILWAALICMASLLAGCLGGSLQRGMLGNAYVSTARPSITVEAKNMPLLTAGRGLCNMAWSGMAAGLPIEVWLAVYGQGGLSPLAIVAQAQTPEGWYWDGIMNPPFSVDVGTETFGGVSYQASTFIVNPARDPFGQLVTGVRADGQPQLWIVRAFAARYNFNDDKIIMEYREPLPDGVTELTNLPLGQADLLRGIAQRARETFSVGPGPVNPSGVVRGYANNVQWQYMDQKFLGSASQNVTPAIE